MNGHYVEDKKFWDRVNQKTSGGITEADIIMLSKWPLESDGTIKTCPIRCGAELRLDAIKAIKEAVDNYKDDSGIPSKYNKDSVMKLILGTSSLDDINHAVDCRYGWRKDTDGHYKDCGNLLLQNPSDKDKPILLRWYTGDGRANLKCPDLKCKTQIQESCRDQIIRAIEDFHDCKKSTNNLLSVQVTQFTDGNKKQLLMWYARSGQNHKTCPQCFEPGRISENMAGKVFNLTKSLYNLNGRRRVLEDLLAKCQAQAARAELSS